MRTAAQTVDLQDKSRLAVSLLCSLRLFGYRKVNEPVSCIVNWKLGVVSAYFFMLVNVFSLLERMKKTAFHRFFKCSSSCIAIE